MKDRPFHRMVTIELRFGRLRDIRSVAEAGKVLLHEWPSPREARHAAAMKAVLDALNRTKKPSAARRALVEAAMEAKILVEKPQHVQADRQMAAE